MRLQSPATAASDMTWSKRDTGGIDVSAFHEPDCFRAPGNLYLNSRGSGIHRICAGLASNWILPIVRKLDNAASFLGWHVVAVLLIAIATKQGRTRVNVRIDQEVSNLTDSINQLRENYQDQIADLQDRELSLRNWAHDTVRILREKTGVNLTLPTTPLRGSIQSGAATMTGSLGVSPPPSRRGHLLFWVNRQGRILRRWARKILLDWDEH